MDGWHPRWRRACRCSGPSPRPRVDTPSHLGTASESSEPLRGSPSRLRRFEADRSIPRMRSARRSRTVRSARRGWLRCIEPRAGSLHRPCTTRRAAASYTALAPDRAGTNPFRTPPRSGRMTGRCRCRPGPCTFRLGRLPFPRTRTEGRNPRLRDIRRCNCRPRTRYGGGSRNRPHIGTGSGPAAARTGGWRSRRRSPRDSSRWSRMRYPRPVRSGW